MADSHDTTTARRGFLRGLAGLPLVGGGVTLIGQPTAAAEPITKELIDAYDAWLHFERRYLIAERKRDYWHRLAPEHRVVTQNWFREQAAGFDHVPMDNAGGHFHFSIDPLQAPQPSSRAAIVLSAVGCDWRHA
jgi:hypothetical protein